VETENEPTSELKIRRARVEDIPTLGKLGSELALQHYGYDKLRFTMFQPLEENHSDFFANEITDKESVVLILEINDEVCGYAFIRLEPSSLVELYQAGAWLHDVYLTETARGKGVSKRFFDAILSEARLLGSDHLMLSVSPHNTTAQKFFVRCGFRPTMLEMRLDFETDVEKF
jgi:GNAT superfamily N-acetyltransferase